MTKNYNVTMSFNTDKKQAAWLEEMAKLNDRPKSYFIRLGIEKIIEMTGGYPDEQL